MIAHNHPGDIISIPLVHISPGGSNAQTNVTQSVITDVWLIYHPLRVSF